MLVQQPQSKSKIVTVQAAGKLQEISWNQQEKQQFSAGIEKPIRFLDITSCAGRGKTTTWDDRLRNKSTDPIWVI